MSMTTHRISHKFCLCVLLIIATVVSLCGCRQQEKSQNLLGKVTNPSTALPTTYDEAELLVENPINFDELKSLNKDLYAWIKVPGTVIDYPIAQSSNEDDNYYLHHNYLGNYEFAGTIYSQRHNTKYFVDRVTVLYGHNMLDGSMFASLHDFSDKEFFEKHEYMYIYIKEHILTYKIFAAYDYDDRHILNSFNFYDEKVYEDYLYSCLHPRYENALVREDVTLNTSNKILTLSTCTNYNSNRRFLVQGVLINDQRTR